MYSDLTNHQKFLLHLDRSQDALFVVARHLYRQGFSLKLFGVKKAPSAAENYNYRDNGDIYISKDDKLWQRVEVKGLSAEFRNKNACVSPSSCIAKISRSPSKSASNKP